jgi:type IV pilus assembly protein PilN
MIRINLLPFRAARKKENVKRQITIYFLLVFFLFAVMAYFFLNLNSQVSALKTERDQKKKELAPYKGTKKKLQNLKKEIAEIRAKLGVIKTLEKKKKGPVRLLDEISQAVPKNKLWLRSLKEKKGILTLSGTAMDHETVALFMTNLENAKLVNSVDLNTTKLKRLKKYKLDVTDFTLDCKTYAYKKKVKKKKKKSRKR